MVLAGSLTLSTEERWGGRALPPGPWTSCARQEGNRAGGCVNLQVKQATQILLHKKENLNCCKLQKKILAGLFPGQLEGSCFL